ncbi:MAG: acetylxylan esterase [Planctomycetaceae bacterium]|nr:acetylxylan esterase [Planctomycetaceae bacterium]
MRHRRNLLIYVSALVLLSAHAATTRAAELADYPSEVKADIPVNYTEAEVGDYELPDPLSFESGQPVDSAAAWRERRRPELHAIFERHQYGRAPAEPREIRYEVTEPPTPALDGAAVREQVTIHFGTGDTAQHMDLLVYVPADRDGPSPLLLSISFMPNNMCVDDPAVHVGRRWDRREGRRVAADGPSPFPGRLPVRQFIDRGFAIATFCYSDVDPDAPGAIEQGVRQQYLPAGKSQPADDEWGAIAAWCWGISRAVDYFEADDLIDAQRIAITGISRLGKTVMWAGANDQRIAAVIASCSGEGGAALSRRNYGETIAHLTAVGRFDYQFCKNYQHWAPDPTAAPVDAHELVALIAPRPLLLQTGTTDKWSDPKGEFLAAAAATPVYELLGETGVEITELPDPDTLVGGTLAYYMHDGGHGMVPGDWQVFLDFLQQHLGE